MCLCSFLDWEMEGFAGDKRFFILSGYFSGW